MCDFWFDFSHISIWTLVASGMLQTFNERMQTKARNASCYLRYFCQNLCLCESSDIHKGPIWYYIISSTFLSCLLQSFLFRFHFPKSIFPKVIHTYENQRGFENLNEKGPICYKSRLQNNFLSQLTSSSCHGKCSSSTARQLDSSAVR